MDMKKYIEEGTRKAGNNKALSKLLNQSESILCDVKAGKRGLNDAACIKLAYFIEVNPLYVIAASNLVTEKDEEKRKLFESCFTTAAGLIFLLVTVGNFGLLSSETSTSVLATAVYYILC